MHTTVMPLNEEWVVPAGAPPAKDEYHAVGWAFRCSKGVYMQWMLVGELLDEADYYQRCVNYAARMLRESCKLTVSEIDVEDEVEEAVVWSAPTPDRTLPSTVRELLAILRKETHDGEEDRKEEGGDQVCSGETAGS